MQNEKIISDLISRYPALTVCKQEIKDAALAITGCFKNKGKLLVCGNGGSAADADHITGELMKSFEKERKLDTATVRNLQEADPERGPYLAAKLQPGLPVISLNVHGSLVSAVANDMDAGLVFAQQVAAYGSKGDVLIAITTSGNSPNVIDAAITARALGLTVIGLTGKSGGKLKNRCDITIRVPARQTAEVQELHMPVYHTLCRITEQEIFG